MLGIFRAVVVLGEYKRISGDVYSTTTNPIKVTNVHLYLKYINFNYCNPICNNYAKQTYVTKRLFFKRTGCSFKRTVDLTEIAS